MRDMVSDEAAGDRTLILMVLGAGRGPLVRASIKAAELSCRKIKVYAVEKNPNAGKITINYIFTNERKHINECSKFEYNGKKLFYLL